jgi:hypothetical protein
MIVVAVAAVGLAALKFASTTMRPIFQGLTGVFLFAFLVKAVMERGARQAFAIGFVLCAVGYVAVVYLDNSSTSETGTTVTAGKFGTGRVLDVLYAAVVSNIWLDDQTGKAAPSISVPPEVTTLTRIESTSPKSHADADQNEDSKRESTVVIASRGSQGRRSARSSTGRGIDTRNMSELVPASAGLTAEQADEFKAAGEGRKREIARILAMPEGQLAVNAGTPLSSLKLKTYSRITRPAGNDFYNVGYCLFALVIGYMGGHFARYVYARRSAHSTT